MRSEVGCLLPWDSGVFQLPDCATIDVTLLVGKMTLNNPPFTLQQLQLRENITLQIAALDLEDVVQRTGCLKPCRYSEYSLPSVPEKTTLYNGSHVFLIPASKTVTKKTETLLYPFTSFVSEFGGALGLFVGFSFWMILDLIEVTFKFIAKCTNTTIQDGD